MRNVRNLIKKNSKLNKQVVDEMALQGARNMIWDKIISKADKFKPYLDLISNQEDALKLAKKNVVIEKQEFHKRPVEVAQNAINFLRTLSEYQTNKCGI